MWTYSLFHEFNASLVRYVMGEGELGFATVDPRPATPLRRANNMVNFH